MAAATPRRKEMIRGQYAGSNEAMVGGLQPSIGGDLVGMAARREKGYTAATMDHEGETTMRWSMIGYLHEARP